MCMSQSQLKPFDKYSARSSSLDMTTLCIEGLRDIEKDWLDIEKDANNRFFLSWTWIGTWLECIKPKAIVIRVYADELLVGIAIVVEHRAHLGLTRRLLMHQTGNDSEDQMWIEYNDILVRNGHEDDARKCFANYLATELNWDQFVLGASSESTVQAYKNTLGLPSRDLWRTHTYGIHLSECEGTFLSGLSRNTRYQINRSFKRYTSLGMPLEMSVAETLEQAERYFDSAAPFHLARWGAAVGESGFANEIFVNFHKALIKNGWEKGQVTLIRLHQADKDIGYFYFFVYRNVVYFYLSGLTRESDSKLKPGLCGHTLCIDYFASRGLVFYDLMGGDERYKLSLAERYDTLCRTTIERPRMMYYVGKSLRKLKQKIASQMNPEAKKDLKNDLKKALEKEVITERPV